MALPETIVLSLPDDVERRDHIRKHFETIGIENYRFANAIAADSDLVSLWYATDRVKSYPPCFRCGHVKCDCENNILIPAQVANCISFAQIWASLPKDPTRLYMICEDDVLFFPGAVEKLKQFLDAFQSNSKPTLIRLSESGLPTDQLVTEELITTDEPVMSNPAFIINGAMAQYLTDRFKHVETTSDIWLHKRIASQPTIQAMTIKPFLATELSYNALHARFASNIHPKGINQEDLHRKARHTKHADSPMAYENLRAKWSGMQPAKQCNYLATEAFQMRCKFHQISEFETYSKISAQIYSNLKDPTSRPEDFRRLIDLSYRYAQKNKVNSIELLHAKYVASGKLKYGDCVLFGLFKADELRVLKSDFEKDPSDMRLVIQLAIAYALDGYKQRAKQLLERVCCSGYPERSQAKKIIEKIDEGNLLG